MIGVIPSSRSRRTTIPLDATVYGTRNRVERSFDEFKHFKCIATRYDLRATHSWAFINLAALSCDCAECRFSLGRACGAFVLGRPIYAISRAAAGSTKA